jgi:type I restriction enzyme S subunit
MNDELPRGWVQATIGDVADGMKNGLYKPASSYADNGVACLRMYNIDAGKIIWKNIKRMKLSSEEVREYQLLPGDLLVNRVNSRELVGKAAIVPHDIEACVFESKNIRLRLRQDLVCPELVNYKLLLSGSQHFIHNAQQVVGMASVSQPQVAAFELPLPPFPEQQRIVAKLEKLLAQVDACQQRLTRIPTLLKRFRQAILDAACSGRLTADWREDQRKIQPAAERWGLGELSSIEQDTPSDLPKEWICRRLNDISERVSVGHVGPTSKYYCAADEGIPFVRSQNVRPGKLEMEDVQYITREFHDQLRKSQLKGGDLLIVRVGANRGDACVVPRGAGPLNCANIVFARPFEGISEYLEFFCQSRHGHSLLLEMTTGSAQGVINTKAAAELPIPIPPEKEQQEIVRRVERLFALSDRIEARFAEGAKRVDSIAQAILAKAFRGELVPTEYELAKAEGRSFESAEELLKRIKRAPTAEKPAIPQKTARSNKTAKRLAVKQ